MYPSYPLNKRRRSPLVFHLVALALFLFSPRVSCLVLAFSLSSSRSRCVLPLIFGSPLEDLTARVDPPSLRLPAGSTTRTSSKPDQRNKSGFIANNFASLIEFHAVNPFT